MNDHLGNVLATVLDRKIGASLTGVKPTAGSTYDHWNADVASSTDYYPGGMSMIGRTTEYRLSRLGFNGQLKDDEVYGKGNLNTAMFWEYDTRRLGRWNVDIIRNPTMSPYAVFNGNPIVYADPLGAAPEGKIKETELKEVVVTPKQGATNQARTNYLWQKMSMDNRPRTGDLNSYLNYHYAKDLRLQASFTASNYANRAYFLNRDLKYTALLIGVAVAPVALPEIFSSALFQQGAMWTGRMAIQASKWSYKNLLTTNGQWFAPNPLAGAADLTCQLFTKDFNDINLASTTANMFLGPLTSSLVGYSIDLSPNALAKDRFLVNPLSGKAAITITIGTVGNFGAGKLGTVGQSWLFEFTTNTANNAASGTSSDLLAPQEKTTQQ